MNKEQSFHWIVKLWLGLCLAFLTFVLVYNVYDIIAGVIRGDHVGMMWRLIFGIIIFALFCTGIGFEEMLVEKNRKGFWEALFYPIGTGVVIVAILMIWANASFVDTFIFLVPTILVPCIVMLITYGVLQIKHNGIRGWDLLM